jgi:hypothetical protein
VLVVLAQLAKEIAAAPTAAALKTVALVVAAALDQLGVTVDMVLDRVVMVELDYHMLLQVT